jgi:hypothetical protein
MSAKIQTVAVALLAIALVVGVLVAVSYQTNNTVTTTHTEEFTTTSTSLVTTTSVVNRTTTVSILGNVELTGSCTAVGVFVPDTTSAGVNETGTYGNTTYSTTTYVNTTGWYVIRTTTYDSQDLPSERYTVTACTFGEDY